MRATIWLAVVAVVVGACGGSDDSPALDAGPWVCSDLDGDGYGRGRACSGPDCDDSNPDVWTEEQCAALCRAEPHSTGCACDLAVNTEPEFCFEGPEWTLGIGRCRAGLRQCEDRRWSRCDGQVLPETERCDGEDNDCDGEVDEGVTGECDNCEIECERACYGIGCESFTAVLFGADGMEVDDTGGLVLAGGAESGEAVLRIRPCPEIGLGTIVSWEVLDWEADLPGGASLRFEARVGWEVEDLEAAAWIALAEVPPEEPPLDLSFSLPGGRILELRLELTSGGVSPSVRRLALDAFCGHVD